MAANESYMAPIKIYNSFLEHPEKRTRKYEEHNKKLTNSNLIDYKQILDKKQKKSYESSIESAIEARIPNE